MDVSRLRAFGPGPSPGFDPLAAVPRSAARVERGNIRHLEAHLERLSVSAAALGVSVPWLAGEADALRAWVAAETGSPVEALRLRLHGARVWALLEPVLDPPSPYRLALLPHPHGSPHPLAPHKGLLGTWNLDALRKAKEAGADDALLHRPDGALLETAIAAIALEVGGELWLPPFEGRVASLAERLDFPAWAGARSIRARAFTTVDLERGRLWCFNAVRGVWPGVLI